MQGQDPGAGRAALNEWSEKSQQNAAGIADMLGVPQEAYAADPLSLLAALQNYVSSLPLNEFEQSDWYTLHSDLASCLADILIRRRGAEWNVVQDSTTARGYRYVLQARGQDGSTHRVDPYDVVMEEFQNLPIEITRMIGNAEVTLGVTRLRTDE
ncbi:hypothetical protein PJ985_22475 [Streptomyces sp. ACA25]|uniref:hypothetical protein n=1 Tax=Streptomyces sp. ACA25 TaxID=3022596 RepID=UPI0023074D2C|nr:hypothetical protein [Streptomyces sp. ACA25]MDB1090320.1 hypothetical protein [Streptomyces sp. ACA25]